MNIKVYDTFPGVVRGNGTQDDKWLSYSALVKLICKSQADFSQPDEVKFGDLEDLDVVCKACLRGD